MEQSSNDIAIITSDCKEDTKQKTKQETKIISREHRLLDIIAYVTKKFSQRVDIILNDLVPECDDGENCDCSILQLLETEDIELDDYKLIRIELTYFYKKYIYTVKIINKFTECTINMFIIKNKNLDKFTNSLKEFSKDCTKREIKKCTTNTTTFTKSLLKWIKYYIDLEVCSKCNIFATTINDMCLSCNTKTLNLKHHCTICLQEDNYYFTKLDCGHIFHYKCIDNKDIEKCPLCRKLLENNGEIIKNYI